MGPGYPPPASSGELVPARCAKSWAPLSIEVFTWAATPQGSLVPLLEASRWGSASIRIHVRIREGFLGKLILGAEAVEQPRRVLLARRDGGEGGAVGCIAIG